MSGTTNNNNNNNGLQSPLGEQQQMANTLNGTTSAHMRQQAPTSGSSGGSSSHNNNNSNTNSSIRRNAYVKITEQPASKALRFRYECEGRSAGSIPGVSSTAENKTFPSIQVMGYRGRAVVVVSCVTKDPPYRPHPHNLVGKEGCKKGVCTVEINNDAMSVSFSNLGIQCVKKRDIEEALRSREEIRVDPYRTGFTHRNQPSSIDLNSVRLCFQVFLESETRGRFTVPLAPVVSDPIFDKKAMSDLVICKLSDASCSVAGGKDMILLCEKVAKEDIAVRFFEEAEGNLAWESFGDFQHTNVHKQVAISFRTPRYKTIDVEKSVKCYIQLKRPSDGVTSEALPFEYYPLDSDGFELKRKRTKMDPESHLYKQLTGRDGGHIGSPHNKMGTNYNQNILNISDVKTEPMDRLSPFTPMYAATPSPQPPASHSPAYINQQQFSPIPQHYANNTYIYQQSFNQPLQPNEPFAGMQQMQQQHLPQQLSSNQYNIQPQVHVFNVPDKPLNIPLNLDSVVAASSSSKIDSGAINLSGLLDLENSTTYSGDLSGISLSLLEPFQASTTNEPNLQQQHQQQQHQQQPDVLMEPENMTDSFTRFTLNQL